MLDEDKLVGIDSRKHDLISLLFEDISELQVVAVPGMGGLGKTTLVSKVCADSQVKEHFEDPACISQSFNKEDLLRHIINQLFRKGRAPEGVEDMDSHGLKTIIKYFLCGKRYLIILDDNMGGDAWDDAFKIAFPDNNNGSRLIIATRNADVASSSTNDLGGRIYSFEESWTLFCERTFPRKGCPPHLEIFCLEINLKNM